MSPNRQRGADESQSQVANDVEPLEQPRLWQLDSPVEREATWNSLLIAEHSHGQLLLRQGKCAPIPLLYG